MGKGDDTMKKIHIASNLYLGDWTLCSRPINKSRTTNDITKATCRDCVRLANGYVGTTLFLDTFRNMMISHGVVIEINEYIDQVDISFVSGTFSVDLFDIIDFLDRYEEYD